MVMFDTHDVIKELQGYGLSRAKPKALWKF
jgi:hypothetical protein